MNNITIIKREESDDQIRYCEIHGTKWINRMKLPEHKRMSKGDIFNVYRREYKTDAEGNITEWICDTKHGCEYDGKSKGIDNGGMSDGELLRELLLKIFMQ